MACNTSAFCARYFQALVSNMGLLRYKEVYAAAAEVLGLALQYIAERQNVSNCIRCVTVTVLNMFTSFIWLLHSATKISVLELNGVCPTD